MNPFDGPPSSPPVALGQQPPTSPPAPPALTPNPEPSGRGRMVVAVFATAGVIGGLAFGVSELVSADDEPALETSAEPVDEPADEPAAEPAEQPDEPADEPSDQDDDLTGTTAEGELRIDVGEGDPIIIDLDEVDPEALGAFAECMGLPNFEFGGGLPGLDGNAPEQFEQEFDEMFPQFDPEQLERDLGQFFDDLDPEQFEQDMNELFDSGQFGDLFEQFFGEFDQEQLDELFGDLEPGGAFGDEGAGAFRHRVMPGPAAGAFGDGVVTITGTDGLTVIDLGDGDGSVTVTRDGETGELTVTTDGTATESDLADVFGSDVFGSFDLGPDAAPGPFGGFDREQLDSCLAELD